MKRPHTDVGQKENQMPLPNSKETTFPHSEEQSLRQQVTSFEEWRALAGAWPLKRLVALWNDRPGVPPVQKFTNREIAWRESGGFFTRPSKRRHGKPQNRRIPFGKGRKQPRCMRCWAARRERRGARSNSSRDGNGTACEASCRRACGN